MRDDGPSGVLFDVSRIFSSHPWVIRLYDFYPLYQVLQMARGSLMTNHPYNHNYWISFPIFAVVTFCFGLAFFWVAEERYGRVD